MTVHRAITRSRVGWLVAVVAVVAVILALGQPWYAHVSTSGDYKGLGQTSDGFRLVFDTGKAASPARTRTVVILQILLVIAGLAVLVASCVRSRPLAAIAGACTALAIATGMSIYVLAAQTAIWKPGLTWLWVAAGALGLLLATRLLPGPAER
jgi:hypothetical protein